MALTATPLPSGAAGIDTLVCDYGGVLTNPLAETYAAFAELTGLGLEAIGTAFAAATRRFGVTPMADLEVAAITESEFIERLMAELPPGSEAVLGGRPFGELWFRGRHANGELVSFLRQLRSIGYRTALLTNNVREWEPRWRATLPVDELFDLVVDSSVERVRKPDPEIYRRLLHRLGTAPERCLLLDDMAENCATARELGMHAVLFEDTAQAVREVTALLGAGAVREVSALLGHPLTEQQVVAP